MDNNGRKRPTRPGDPNEAKEPDPLWTWAEQAGRESVDDSKHALGQEAAARLRLLRQAAGNFGARLPSVEEWAAFLRTEIVPVYNAIVPGDRMCVECGKKVGAGKKATTRVCSPECASANEARRRPKGASATKPHAALDTTKITVGSVAAVSSDDKNKKR